jgi:hypothetical protein
MKSMTDDDDNDNDQRVARTYCEYRGMIAVSALICEA